MRYKIDYNVTTGERTETPYTPEEEAIADREQAEAVKQNLVSTVDNHLDATAQQYGYDNITNACSYAAAPNSFQIQSQAFVSWRGAVWDTCYQILAEVQAGTRPIPTPEELIAALPVFVNP